MLIPNLSGSLVSVIVTSKWKYASLAVFVNSV